MSALYLMGNMAGLAAGEQTAVLSSKGKGDVPDGRLLITRISLQYCGGGLTLLLSLLPNHSYSHLSFGHQSAVSPCLLGYEKEGNTWFSAVLHLRLHL